MVAATHHLLGCTCDCGLWEGSFDVQQWEWVRVVACGRGHLMSSSGSGYVWLHVGGVI